MQVGETIVFWVVWYLLEVVLFRLLLPIFRSHHAPKQLLPYGASMRNNSKSKLTKTISCVSAFGGFAIPNTSCALFVLYLPCFGNCEEDQLVGFDDNRGSIPSC